jgi:hypothetical protein
MIKKVMLAGYLCGKFGAKLSAGMSASIFIAILLISLPKSGWDTAGFLQGTVFLVPFVLIFAAFGGFISGGVYGCISMLSDHRGRLYVASIISGLTFHVLAKSFMWILPSRNPKGPYYDAIMQPSWFAVIWIIIALWISWELIRFYRHENTNISLMKEWAKRMHEIDSQSYTVSNKSL